MDLSQFYSRRNASQEARADVIVDSQEREAPVMNSLPSPSVGKYMPEGMRRRLVGFLFSVSHVQEGEFWALYLGDTVIGNGEETDICLLEKTVSHIHATVTSQIDGGKLKVSIVDNQSVNGTLVNGEYITATDKVCYDGDIITIGKHYQLLLLLADTNKYGLTLSKGFQEGSSYNMEEEDNMNRTGEGTLSLNIDGINQLDETRII